MQKQLFFLLIFLFSLNQAYAQSIDKMSDEEVMSFIKQAQDSGMSEGQLMAAAAAKGFSASDIVKFKDRLGKIQSGKPKTTTKVESKNRGVDSTEIEKDISNSKIKDILKVKEELDQEKRDKIFGLNIFNKKRANFEPNLNIPMPKNYILGTGDELSIDISGYAYAHYEAKISNDGTIRIENLSPIFVSGQTVDQAKDKIIQRLRTLYGGLSRNGSLTADVSVSKIRSIKVSVVGEAVFPGTFTVPSVATALSLIFEAGGPSEIGSMRRINIIRNGRILRTLDLYDLLLKGIQSDNPILQDQDVIHIPYVENRVTINGAVRNPKIFEVEKHETLQEVLEFAGGFNEEAYTKIIKIDRTTATERKILTIDKSQLLTFQLQKGDIIKVDSILQRYENTVSISGAVFRPGKYELNTGLTLKNLIIKAEGLKPEAFKNRAIIIREKPYADSEIISADLNSIFLNNADDIMLQIRDSIVIKTYIETNEERFIQIDGEVNNPSIIKYIENITVKDAILLAGGLTEGASIAKIEIARRVREDNTIEAKNQTIEIINYTIDRELKTNGNTLKLMPFDKIFVRKMTQYAEQKNVMIMGEVYYAGPYALQDKTERISDLINKSGGLQQQADLGSAKFTRDGKQVGIDIRKVLTNRDDINNLLLYPNDTLLIPRKRETVAISGNVYTPTIVPYEKSFSLMDYISLAGGHTDSAFVRKSYVKYGNGSLARTKSFMGIKKYPKISGGAEIFIPTQKKTRWTPAERIAVSSAVISIATVLITIVLRVIPSS